MKPLLLADSNDSSVPPQYEGDMAKRIHARVATLSAVHISILSMPQRVADVIIDAANKTGK